MRVQHEYAFRWLAREEEVVVVTNVFKKYFTENKEVRISCLHKVINTQTFSPVL